MIQRVIYKGEVIGSYNILPFSSMMQDFRGVPIPEVFKSLTSGERSCAWALPEGNVVCLDYSPLSGNKYRAIVTVMGKEKAEVEGLEKRIKGIISRTDGRLSRSEGRAI